MAFECYVLCRPDALCAKLTSVGKRCVRRSIITKTVATFEYLTTPTARIAIYFILFFTRFEKNGCTIFSATSETIVDAFIRERVRGVRRSEGVGAHVSEKGVDGSVETREAWMLISFFSTARTLPFGVRPR